MTTEIITHPSQVKVAWSKQYERLARTFVDALGKGAREVAEIGCGSGQLTIPLTKHAPRLRLVLIDTFADYRSGSFSNQRYRALVSNLRKAQVTKRTRVVVSDYLEWIRKQDDATYDALITSEFLPEITSAATRVFIRESYRALKPKGAVIHSFLSPTPRNSRQKLVIEADSNPLWTQTPPKEWFSPKPQLVVRELRKTGFHPVRQSRIVSHLIVKAGAARSLLKSWGVRSSFYEEYKTPLITSGLEIPDWIVVSGIKP